MGNVQLKFISQIHYVHKLNLYLMLDFFVSYICPWYVVYFWQRYLYLCTKKLTRAANISVVEPTAESYNCSFYQNFIELNTIFYRNFLLKKNTDQKVNQGVLISMAFQIHTRVQWLYNIAQIKIICGNLSFLNNYFHLRALIYVYTDLYLITCSPKGPTFMVQNFPNRTTKDLGMW